MVYYVWIERKLCTLNSTGTETLSMKSHAGNSYYYKNYLCKLVTGLYAESNLPAVAVAVFQ